VAYLAGPDRTQAVLLPEVLDDYVGADNPVRFLDAFVAQLDLGALGFQRAVPAETGRPGYDPGDLLRLYLYGYLHRIRSSRRLERLLALTTAAAVRPAGALASAYGDVTMSPSSVVANQPRWRKPTATKRVPERS
jgi:hypothetical protein